MSFFEELKTDVRKAADYTIRKTGEFSDTAKKKLALHDCESDLRRAYERLGRLYYRVNGGDDTKKADVDSAVEDIKSLEKKLSDLRNNADL